MIERKHEVQVLLLPATDRFIKRAAGRKSSRVEVVKLHKLRRCAVMRANDDAVAAHGG